MDLADNVGRIFSIVSAGFRLMGQGDETATLNNEASVLMRRVEGT